MDLAPGELTTFDALVIESRRASPAWHVVFIAGLSGHGGNPPASDRVDSALEQMVERVRSGRLDPYLALDSSGEAVVIS